MRGICTLISGVLSVIAVLALTAIILALAPFLAGGFVIAGLFFIFFKFWGDEDFSSEPKAKTKMSPRE